MFVIEPDRFRKLRKSVLWRDCCNELHGSENSHYNLSTKMLDKCAICFYCIYSVEQRQWHPTPVLLPGKIPWTEEPGRLHSRGSLRVGHD